MHDAYLQLKLAWELFQTAPGELDDAQRTRVSEVVARQYGIEQRILASSEAAQVAVPPATLAARLGEIRQRYTDADTLAHDLARSGLDEADLEEAVSRDLRIEAVLERIAAAVPAVTAVDAEIFYRMHPEAFDRPETRRLRHILITFDSARDKADATARLETLRHTVKDADAFGKVALRHSQCPTAMEGGKLGTIRRGQLFPELEPAAFALEAGEISPVLESPIGLHIILCEEILPFGIPPFNEVRNRIIDRLTDKRRQTAQKEWIKGLAERG
ncbi:nitrogen fixation protein NifM [Zoogloea sp.]|uniref:nitrogen fixation protein NifM n=1 Tax=Zoogloea sp. TaxID=49181 RepID=UPI0035AFCCEA